MVAPGPPDPSRDPESPALVILAAGASTRLGQCKALADLGGRTALARLLAAGAALDPRPLVVTGAHGTEIEAAGPWSAELLHHSQWQRGRTGGLARAAALRPGRDLCVAPVDTPLVPEEVFLGLLAAWHEAAAPALGWLSPRCGGRHGHPLILGRGLAALLAALAPDSPLRDLRSRARPLLAWETPLREVLDDLDTPQDLSALRRRILPG